MLKNGNVKISNEEAKNLISFIELSLDAYDEATISTTSSALEKNTALLNLMGNTKFNTGELVSTYLSLKEQIK